MRVPGFPTALLCVCLAGAARADDSAFVKRQVSVQGIVVMETSAGMIGQALDIILTVSPRDTGPTRFDRAVGEEMTISLDEAVRTVQLRYPDWDGGHVIVSFEDKYSPKDGGSAGTAMAVGLCSLLQGFDLDPHYAMTGDITVDQRVRRIGGVGAKIKGATADGAKVVAIPQENEDAIGDLLLLESPTLLLDTQVFTVATLDEALDVAQATRPQAHADAIKQFAEVQASLESKGIGGLRTPEVKAKLDAVVALTPNHASAKHLLRWINGESPDRLSLTGSIVTTIDRARPALEIVTRLEQGRPIPTDRQAVRDASKGLQQVRRYMHPDAQRFHTAVSAFLGAGTKIIESRTHNNRMIDDYNRNLAQMVAEYEALGRDAGTIEAMLRESY